MSREIRRVPADFDWPLRQVWSGYLAPDSLHEMPCPADCHVGETPSRTYLSAIAMLIEQLADDLVAQERGRNLHPYLTALQNVYTSQRPSADAVDLVVGLTGRPATGPFGFMGANHRILNKIVEASGLDAATWGLCLSCGGYGSVEAYPGQRAEAEAWEPTDPPTGDAWQVWETTSEGSPISPVFADRDGLIGFLMSRQYYGFGTSPTPLTREQAEAFVDAGSSMGSMVIANGQMYSGDVAVHELGNGA